MKIKFVKLSMILLLALFSCKKGTENDGNIIYSGKIKSLTLKMDNNIYQPLKYSFYYENGLLSKIILENNIPNLTTALFYYDKKGFLVKRLVREEEVFVDNPQFPKIEYFYTYKYENNHISMEIMDSTVYYKANQEILTYGGLQGDYTDFIYDNNRITTISYNTDKTYKNALKVELAYNDLGNIINLKRYSNGEYFEQIEYSLYDDVPNPLENLKDKNGFPLLDCDWNRFWTTSTFSKNNCKQLKISEIKSLKNTSLTYLYQYNSDNYPQNIYLNQREWTIAYY